jgi:hypothetical protein
MIGRGKPAITIASARPFFEASAAVCLETSAKSLALRLQTIPGPTFNGGGSNMSNRGYNPSWNREDDPRRGEGRESFSDHDDYGLHSQDRSQYRGRESYEQQSRSGQGGRSGAFEQRTYPPGREDLRSSADESRRGYQTIGQRAEFESSYRGRLGLHREGQGYRGDEDRYGFDSQDFNPGYNQGHAQGRDFGRGREGSGRSDWQPYRGEDNYSRNDYGTHPYGSYGSAYPRMSSPYGDYAPRRDYGQRNRDYGGSPYGEPQSSSYERDEYRAANQPRWGGQGGPDYGQRSAVGQSWTGPSSDASRYYGSGDYAQSVLRRGGKGPKGYKRSDERIREDVCDRLSHQWDLDATDIEVTVSNGEVTLTGTINDRDQKHRAENVADAVSGVNDVHNQLRVKREQYAPQGERDQGEREQSQGGAGAGASGKASPNQSSRQS